MKSNREFRFPSQAKERTQAAGKNSQPITFFLPMYSLTQSLLKSKGIASGPIADEKTDRNSSKVMVPEPSLRAATIRDQKRVSLSHNPA